MMIAGEYVMMCCYLEDQGGSSGLEGVLRCTV